MNSERQCSVCHIGTGRERRTTYLDWLDGHLVILPNVTIWVCDVCGDIVYDDYVIALLELLLGVEPGSSEAGEKSLPVAGTDQPPMIGRRRGV